MKYPSKINFDVDVLSNCLSVYYNDKKPKFTLGIWALAYLLNEGLYENKIRTIYITANDITTALRLHILSESKLFRNISWEIKYSDDLERQVDGILKDVHNEKYVTYKEEFSERGTNKHPESKLERSLCKDLSTLCGDDFDKKTKFIRQFPANIFERKISENNRVTDKFWIDVLTINKQSQLSVIELKAGDNCLLDLFVQAIDYAIFCHIFKSHIDKHYFDNSPKVNNNKIAVYLVAEKFHPALIGRDNITGIQTLIHPNELFDFIFINIQTNNNKLASIPQVLFDTRKLKSNNP